MNGVEVVDEAEGISGAMSKTIETTNGRIISTGSPSNPVVDQWNAFRAAAELSGEQVREMAHKLQDAYVEATEPISITYTNRAARRARARAERSRR